MWNIKNINSSFYDVDEAVKITNNLIFGDQCGYWTDAFQLSYRYGWHTDGHKFYERNTNMKLDKWKSPYFIFPFVKGRLFCRFYHDEVDIVRTLERLSDELFHYLIFRIMSWVPVFLLKDNGMQIPIRINDPWDGKRKTILTPIDTMTVGFNEQLDGNNVPFDWQRQKLEEMYSENDAERNECQEVGKDNEGYIVDFLGAYFCKTPCIFLWTDKIHRLAEDMACSTDEDVVEKYFQNLVVIVFLHELMHALFHVDKPVTKSILNFEETFANTSVLYLLESYKDKDLLALAEHFMSTQPYWYRKGLDLYHSSIEYDTVIENFFAMKSGKMSEEDFQTKILLNTLKLV